MCALVNSLQISDENLPLSLVQQDGAYWRSSFSLAELNVVRNRLSPVHRELYKALKLLRDIHIREGDTPSHALKSIVFNYVVKENAEATLEKPTGKTAAASAYLPECISLAQSDCLQLCFQRERWFLPWQVDKKDYSC